MTGRARPRWSVAAALAAGLVWPGASPAEEGGARPFSWRPSIQVRGVATDNINLTKHDRDGDYGIIASPRVEAAWRTPAYELDFDGSIDARSYTDDKRLDHVYYRVYSGAEVGLLPGLTARLSDAYTPQPERLGQPDDDIANLIQTNRADLELRYWRELPGGREIAAGALGGRFDTERFDALVSGPGDSVVVDEGFRADFWEGAGFVEFQNPLGEQHSLYLRGLARHRSFDEDSDGDHLEASGLLGLRSHYEEWLELDLAGGWGWLDFRHGSGDSHAIGMLDLKVRRPGGWRFTLGVQHLLTVDITGEDFLATTGRLGVEKYFGKRTAAELVLFASHLHSDATHPHSNVFGGVEVSLRRQLSRRVEASIAYRYWDNGGAYDADDFHQNRVVIGVTYRH